MGKVAPGARGVGNASARKRADFIGDPDQPQPDSEAPGVAAGLVRRATDERAVGQVWHLPGPATVTTRALLALVAQEVNHPVGIRTVPRLALRALGLVNPMMRELAEMTYEFEQPFVLNTSKFERTFHSPVTPLAAAIGATVAWYRAQKSR